MDDAHAHPALTRSQAILGRLVAYAPLLAGLVGVVIGFVLLGGLRLDLAILGFILICGFVLALPLPTVTIAAPPPAPLPIAPQATSDDDIGTFVEALADPSLVLDRRGVVIYRNAAALRDFPNLAVGKVLTMALRNPELIASVETALRTGEGRSFELHETLPSETWNRVAVSPLRRSCRDWADDEDRNLLVTVQSLTELKRVDALRSDFIANASHELRTPLASLMGFIDTLLGPAAKDAAAREKFLGIMRGQAERMSRLIDDMLSLSRIEMHQHVRPTGSVDLSGLLREVRESLQSLAKAAEFEIVLDLPAKPAVVTGDRGQLYEVAENLIENAIKYGATGKSVDVSLVEIDRSGLHYQLSVVDHGPGVEPEHVPRMTERFYRIDAETSRKKKGTGLGLAIVKHIVQRHRGQIVIKSRARAGEGLRVEVLLP